MEVKIKRIYEAYAPTDGYRILVDRLWPRGIKKETAHVDLWLKEAAPSNELRKWFGHVPEKFADFCSRYEAELKSSGSLSALKKVAGQHDSVTLLYAAKDMEHNNAVVLQRLLTL